VICLHELRHRGAFSETGKSFGVAGYWFPRSRHEEQMNGRKYPARNRRPAHHVGPAFELDGARYQAGDAQKRRQARDGKVGCHG